MSLSSPLGLYPRSSLTLLKLVMTSVAIVAFPRDADRDKNHSACFENLTCLQAQKGAVTLARLPLPCEPDTALVVFSFFIILKH